MDRLAGQSAEFDFTFNLNGEVERQLRQPDSAQGVCAHFRPEHFQNEVGEAIDNTVGCWLKPDELEWSDNAWWRFNR